MLEQYKILKYKHSNESCVNTDSGKSLTIISNLLLLPVDNKIIRVSPSLATLQGNENVAHEGWPPCQKLFTPKIVQKIPKS